MILRKWEDLPEFMKTDEVRPYYEVLNKKRGSLVLKRMMDLFGGLILLIILAIPMAVIAVLIKFDSEGPVFYRQERITTYGKHFKIHKFRTMVSNADKIGSAVTVGNDSRITKVGAKLRGCRLDELPQVLDLITGDMSFVGTRPEAVKYVEKYRPEYMATLLLPAGITSEASIRYKDEAELLEAAEDVDKVYMEEVLPGKMKFNLQSIKEFSFIGEIKTMFRTVFAVLGKDYGEEKNKA
ncbi:MAG: sugar transferase [Lachnospiraceae bacterium]